MAYVLTDKLSTLTPYIANEGSFDVRLDANESFINVNPALSAKINAEISKIALNRYPDPYAVKAVDAFAEFYNISPEFVTAGNGSDELISIITSCFLAKGDKVLTLTPDFSMYAFYGSLYELDVDIINKNHDLTINVERIITHCNEKNIKALIFSNPCNPTSLGLKRAEVIRILKEVKCLVIIDEAYMDFWNESVLDLAGEFDNLVVLKTCSKSLGLAAVRMGFCIAGKTLTNAMKSAKSPYNTDSISQAITACVLSEKSLLKAENEEIIASREKLYDEIVKLSKNYPVLEVVYESVTNFIFIKTSLSEEIFKALLKKSIAIRNMNGFLRITAGSGNENLLLINELKTILEGLK